jgi:hypothetical protein
MYEAYLGAAERLTEQGARIDRRRSRLPAEARVPAVAPYDGHPDRDHREVARWALEHDLPYFDEQVHFPEPNDAALCVLWADAS